MILITHIEDAWIADINANLKTPLGLKEVGTFEGTFDEEALKESIFRAPYTLLQYVDDYPKETTSKGTNASEQIFSVVVGASSLRNHQEGRRGCYTILEALRTQYDGKIFTIGTTFVQLKWKRSVFVLSVPGLLVYQQIYHITNK